MSYVAINSVTRGLRMLLHSQLVRISSSAVVTLLPPGDALPAVSGVNLYLYRVAESPYFRNRSWPGDRVTPPSNDVALALQLYYLLTPLGARPDDNSSSDGDDAHTMLGAAMITLHENPVLNNVHLPALPAMGSLGATPGFDADSAFPSFILDSYEQIKVLLMPVSVDDLSKIWATINQPYRLSVAYEVSLVQITPPTPPPVNGGIVISTNVAPFLIQAPRIDSLSPQSGALAHLSGAAVVANALVLTGAGFTFPGRTPTVTVGGEAAPIQPMSPPPPTTLTVTLPTDLDAGPQADVRVRLNGRSSAAVPFVVTPWLASVTPVRTELLAGQKLTLKGVGFTTSPQGVLFAGAGAPAGVVAFDAGVTDLQGTVTIPTGLLNGLINVRVVLNDAAQSTTNSRTLEVIPRIDTVALAKTPPTATITISGARLSGNDIRVLLDGVTHQAPPNANAAQLVYTLNRVPPPGPHPLALNIDGHASHTVDLES